MVVLHVICVMLPAAGGTKTAFDSSSLCSYAQDRAQLHCFFVLGHQKGLQLLITHLGAHNTGNIAVCLLMQIKDLGVKAGVVLNPATPIEAIQHVITQVDLILLMSGKLCGQKYIVPCL